MPKNAMKSRGESINHFNGLRIRVIGNGDLQVNVYAISGNESSPDVLVETLLPYTMTSATPKQPTLLANVRQQRASFEVKVTEFGEWFQVQRIVVFAKPLFSQYPGRG
jgi:hypothetical protein